MGASPHTFHHTNSMTRTQAEMDAIVAEERLAAEVRISERLAAAPKPATPEPEPDPVEQLKDQIADAESKREFGKANRLKQQLIETQRRAPTKPADERAR